MKRTFLLLLGICLSVLAIGVPAAGQSRASCPGALVTGTWSKLASRSMPSLSDVDSFIAAVIQMPDSRSSDFVTYNIDGSYTFTDPLGAGKGHFWILEDRCEIRLGRRKNVRNGVVHRILLLNERFMAVRYARPNTDYIAVYRRR